MGLRDKLRSNRPNTALEGEGMILSIQLTRVGARQTEKRNQTHDIGLSVAVHGAAPYEAGITCDVPWNRRPLVGRNVPVIVSARDPLNVSIDWDRMPDLVEQAHAAAEAARWGDTSDVAEALGFHVVSPQSSSAAETEDNVEGKGHEGHLGD
jgi:hypothetical protein